METAETVLLIAISNRGYSDDVMDTARHAGAKGGTVLHGQGTGSNMLPKIFGITIKPEKEVILIISTKEIGKKIIEAVIATHGPGTDAHTIAFTLPIGDLAGISLLPPPTAD